MAIAFYCEEEDPKVYYDSFGYNSASGNFQQLQQSQHAAATASNQQASGVDENNNSNNTGSNVNNCALHGSSPDIVNNRQLMRVVLHQVLYRCTMEGALSPAHTSCVFCNKIYYLFQLLY